MSGTAIVVIGSKQWTVSIANTYSEVLAGLSDVVSIAPNTGMLFDMGSDQSRIDINMQDMLFPLDIIFIGSNSGVRGVLRNVQPTENGCFQAASGLGARYFLEVKAGEAEGVEVGDNVSIQGDTQPSVWYTIPAILAGIAVIPVVGAGLKSMTEKK